MPNERTYTDRFSDHVTSHQDVQEVIHLLTDIALLEGEWVTKKAKWEKNKDAVTIEKEWKDARATLLLDVESYGYDITKWSIDSLSILTHCILVIPEIAMLGRDLILQTATAHARDQQVEAVGRLIRAIVDDKLEPTREEKK